MDKKKYCWIICAGCTLMFFCTAGLGMTGFSAYQPYLISIGGLTNGQASMLTSTRSMFSFLTMFVVERVLHKTDIRIGATLSVLGITLSLALYGIANSFPVYLLAAAVAGASYGVGGMLAVSVMIHRWFDEHQGLAVGICSAGSGFSAVIGTPIITYMVEHFSLKRAFYMEAGFVVLLAIIVFITLRNWPEGAVQKSEFAGKKEEQKKKKEKIHENMCWISKKGQFIIMFGALMMGFTYAASSHVSVLYTSEHFSAGAVSLLVSVLGAALLVGKCIYGAVADKLGSYWSGNLFFGMLILGNALSCLAPQNNVIISVIAVAFVGMGSVLLSVGFTIIADTVSKPQYYATVVRKMQIIYMLGSMVFGVAPGMIADRTGSYIPAFVMMTVFAVIAMLLVQPILYKRTVH